MLELHTIFFHSHFSSGSHEPLDFFVFWLPGECFCVYVCVVVYVYILSFFSILCVYMPTVCLLYSVFIRVILQI